MRQKHELEQRAKNRRHDLKFRSEVVADIVDQKYRDIRAQLHDVCARLNVLNTAMHQIGAYSLQREGSGAVLSTNTDTKPIPLSLATPSHSTPHAHSEVTNLMAPLLVQNPGMTEPVAMVSGQQTHSQQSRRVLPAVLAPTLQNEGSLQIPTVNPNSAFTTTQSSCSPPIRRSERIRSSHWDHHRRSQLNSEYEKELELIKERKKRRAKVAIHRRIYHVNPGLTSDQRNRLTDDNEVEGHLEQYWVGTIDEALQSYIDGDEVQLSEGRHVITGTYKICGTLTVRGMCTSTSNWKTSIVNQCDSQHFIWCIGKDSRVTFENVLLRGLGSR